MKIKPHIWLILGVLFVFNASHTEVIGEDFDGIIESEHNCRIWAAISNDMPDSVIYDHLIALPNSIEHLSEQNNIDGWGIAYYQAFGDSAIIERGAIRAHNDPHFDTVVERLESVAPNIGLAHVRRCSAGCCDHGGDSILDPHPFFRFKNGRYWTFIHNGTVDKALLYELIGEQYLIDNPPNGSDIPECDPSDTSLVTDSELYFLYLLKSIENSGWLTTEGVIEALVELQTISYDEAMNFVLSDGNGLWAFRRDRTLYYYNEPEAGYYAVASMYPTEEQERWREVNDNELLVFSADHEPIIMDLSPHLPSIAGTITNEESQPVADAYVYIPGTGFSFRTGPNGEYSLACLSLGMFNIRIMHSFYADTVVEDVEIPEDSLHIVRDITLRYPGAISGLVTNPRHEPVESVYVFLKGTFMGDFTDSNGIYDLYPLNMGYYEVSLRHSYYSDTSIADVGAFSDSVTVLDVTIGFPGYITGVVYDDSLRPVENMRVYVYRTLIEDFTDEEGVFVFDSLNSGTYDVSFYHINFGDTTFPEVVAAPGDTATINLIIPFLGYAYVPGDMNMYNGIWPPQRIGSDITYLVNYFRGAVTRVPCLIDGLWVSADVNGDCQVNGGDVTRMVMYFCGTNTIVYCPEFHPQWQNPNETPASPPINWPPCEE